MKQNELSLNLENLDKEKGKLEWKKLKILAKEKLNDERVQF